MSKTKSKPGVRPLGNNRYAIRATLVDPATKQRREIKRMITAASLREADDARDALLSELERPAAQKAARMTVSDYAVRWLTLRRATLRPGTMHRYHSHLDRFIAALGSVWIDELSPRMVTDWLHAEAATLSGVTCLNMLRVVRTMTKDATAELQLQRWACDRVKAPKPVRGYADGENALTPEELFKLFQSMRTQSPWHLPLFAFMAYTGLRFCEAHALRWSDVDFETRTAVIVRSRYMKAITDPKTEQSKRLVSLPEELVEILKAQRAELVRRQNPGLSADLAFPALKGGYQWHAGINNAIKAASASIGLVKRFTPHGLRRTMNTLGLQVASAEVVRKVLGHTTAGMTQRYLSVDLDQKRSLASGVAQLVRVAGRNVEGRVEGQVPPMGASNGAGTEAPAMT